MTARARAIFFAPLALVLAGCSLAGDVTPPPGIELTAVAQSTPSAPHPEFIPSALAGATVYAQHCAACHGESGAGDGPSAAQLPNAPANLASPDLARQRSPSEWFSVVTNGRLEAFMPPFADALGETERWNVVYHLYTLSTSPESIARGEAAFAANCAECHSAAGEGLPDLADPASGALRSQAGTVASLLSGGPHEFASALDETTRWDLAAYVQSLHYDYAAPGAAIPPGQVTGRVRNGTDGHAAPAGLEVTLHGFDGFDETVTLTAATEADGRYRFEEVPITPGRNFIVTVEHAGVVYTSEFATAETDAAGLALPVTVYETTSDPSGLRLEQIHVILQDFDGAVRVGELVVAVNGADRTYVGGPDGHTLLIHLPAEHSGLTFQSGELGGRFVTTETGFADTAPVRPGGAQILFSFQMPYGAALDFEQPLRHPAASVNVLIPPGMGEFRGAGFRSAGQQSVQGESYQTFAREDLPEGESIRFRVSRIPINLWIGLVALLVAVAGVTFLWRRRDSSEEGESARAGRG